MSAPSPSMDEVYAAIAEKKAEGERVMSAIDKLTEDMHNATDEIESILVRRPSADEAVVAGVDVRHRLHDLWIKPGACSSLSPTELARSIMSAVSEASSEADKRREAIKLPTLGL